MFINVIELHCLRTKRNHLAYLRHPDLCIQLCPVKLSLLVIVCGMLAHEVLFVDINDPFAVKVVVIQLGHLKDITGPSHKLNAS